MKFPLFPFLFFSLVMPLIITAKNDSATIPSQFPGRQSLCFTENIGQITDQSGNRRTDIQYKAGTRDGLNIFIGKGTLHYQFLKLKNQNSGCQLSELGSLSVPGTHNSPCQFDMYRMDVTLEGADTGAQVVADDQQGYYESFYSGTCSGESARARTFGKITYKNIYPNIDWVLYNKDNHLEYDFVVRPGGNVNDIKLRYDGTTELKKNRELITAVTPLGEIQEGKLYSYIQGNRKEVGSRFVLKKNRLSFDVDHYQGILVIDPTLVWATYYGGTDYDAATGIACDSSGNVYIAGFTSSINNIATIGSYQDSLAGSGDAFLAKFSGNGILQWATYYGGHQYDAGSKVACDNSGNVYLTGYTLSTDSIATPGAYQTMLSGSEDVFLAKFSDGGSLIWATYFGGPGNDQGNGVACDDMGNVYIAGVTGSHSGIATPGAYHTVYGGGLTDAFLAKFTGNGILLWSTYFGGDTTDVGLGLTCTSSSVYLTGVTMSTDSIATPGAFKTSGGGAYEDAFLAKFSSAGLLEWATYFGGSNADVGTAVAHDGENIYLAGLTESTDSIATPGAHQTALLGGGDAFLAKFSPDGAILWATYYGGLPLSYGTSGSAVACDATGNIFITGQTGSVDSIATPGCFKHALSGLTDAYLAEFNSTGTQLWGTYFGGSGTESGSGVACDGLGNTYIVGITNSTDSIATTGAHQTVYGGSYHDGFLAKFGNLTTLGTQPANLLSSADLYPNPANDMLCVAYSNLSTAQIIITDLAGRAIIVENLPGESGHCNININALSSGVYLYEITDNGTIVKMGKVVKK